MERKLRKCSQCGRTGHNYRTCNNVADQSDGVKLFGVYLTNKGDCSVNNNLSGGNLSLNVAARVKNKGIYFRFFFFLRLGFGYACLFISSLQFLLLSAFN